MADVLQALTYAVSLAFIFLGALTLRDYLRHRERSRGFLALAIGLLAITNILGEVQTLTGNALGVVGQDVTIVIFLASGYALLLFRGSFIRLSRRARRPAVQRARLRSLALGYAGLVLILLFAGLGSAVARQPLAQIAIDLVALLA